MTALLVSVLWKGVLVLAVAALASLSLRRAPAAARHGVWAAALAALLALPVLESAGPAWRLPVLPTAAPPAFGLAAPPAPPPAPLPAPPPPPPPPVPPPPPAPPTWAAPVAHAEGEYRAAAFDEEMRAHDAQVAAFDAEMARLDAEAAGAWADAAPPAGGGGAGWERWLAGAWALGAVAVALGWAVAFLAARRLVAAAEPEADEEWAVLFERARRLTGLPPTVRLLRSDRLSVPIAWGWGGGAVVLPAQADGWAEGRREAVVLHELAHLRRRDAWTQALAQAALAVHWPNPGAWFAYRRFLDAREEACDDAVIRGGARPSSYAEHLVGVARGLRRGGAALAAVAPMARRSGLEARVRSVLDPTRRRKRLGRASLAVTVALALAVVVPLAAMQPVERPGGAAAHVPMPAPPVAAPAPPAVPTPPVLEALADTLDALDDAEVALDEAEAQLDRASETLHAASDRLRASRSGGAGGAALDLQSMSLDAAERALADVDVAQVVADALDSVEGVELDAEWRAEMEAAFEEARSEVREARDELRRARAEARARPPGPPRSAAPDRSPPPRPAASAGAVDWADVDRARRAAERRY
ncbi:M56 family metallopeptidase [Rubrivirga litoralis]|uniref:M56 family metallopeptidase n=1 Tax=Rubrivirga litoralis TaxID=3075598 RepID=A0ABU3BN54_9BACT|nr:M56 family metallopeptidase [Rubrivirga sp. F394]MDT0630724.1 M56 family metallopeptidase [Rubrivirga sp. F394]